MLEQINEPVDVVCRFIGNNLTPVKFAWQNRTILVKKVNLTYSRWSGRTKLYYFAVSDDANYFKLEFNTETLAWKLLEIYAE